ncbi:uncharacterized protein RAG0_00207 [Rhynchosporium agropyri]|uniref:Uncharacterized protein n=1 Tax=Rhynchosporium agropyri TaxID=914238 RepID=A0A1E1JS39_9HELO|nr:uncharacterized protein RAG0_00207 [Rhynchosporium agropyri]
MRTNEQEPPTVCMNGSNKAAPSALCKVTSGERKGALATLEEKGREVASPGPILRYS